MKLFGDLQTPSFFLMDDSEKISKSIQTALAIEQRGRRIYQFFSFFAVVLATLHCLFISMSRLRGLFPVLLATGFGVLNGTDYLPTNLYNILQRHEKLTISFKQQDTWSSSRHTTIWRLRKSRNSSTQSPNPPPLRSSIAIHPTNYYHQRITIQRTRP